MKIFLRSCLLFLLIFTSMTTTYAENSSSFIGNYPFFDGYRLAKVHFVGARNTFGEQAIFLKTHNIIIKIYSKNYTHIHGNEIAGYFNKTEKQMLYNYKTGESFEGQVLCKRVLNPNLPVVEPNNIYIKGENNTYANNTVIKGENNISRNNIYIAGSNNTITGNTHYQGSNNVYENNVIIGGSNKEIRNTTTHGASNRTVKGQVIGGNGGNAYSSNSSSWWSEPIIDAENPIFKAFYYIFVFLLIAFVGFAFIIPLGIAYTNDKQEFFKDCKNFVLCIIYFLITPAVAIFVLRKIYLSLSAIHICLICSVLVIMAVIYLYRKHVKNKKEAELRRIEYEKWQAEQYKKEQERKIAYQKEQERISTLPTHYVGNVETGKYHHCICSYARKLHESKKEYFETAEAAESVGYIPCSICKPNQNCEIYTS